MEDLGTKKCFFWDNNSFFVQVHYYSLHGIHAYYTELSLQNCNNAQKRRICRENSKYAPDENFCGHFCPHRKAATLCWGAHYGGDIDDDDIDVVRGEVF